MKIREFGCQTLKNAANDNLLVIPVLHAMYVFKSQWFAYKRANSVPQIPSHLYTFVGHATFSASEEV